MPGIGTAKGRKSKSYWAAMAEEGLPPMERIRQRNSAISARYASWYLENPDLKWAGMAAFASHHIGLALAFYGDLVDLVHTRPGDPQLATPLGYDLGLIRETNNQIYAHLGWAHLAFLSDGPDAVERALSAQATPDEISLAAAFRQIGGAGGATSSATQIWSANRDILWIEQSMTVQPQFERFNQEFAVFLTLFTSLDLDGDEFRIDLSSFSAFPVFMLTWGSDILWQTGSWPDITRLDHRWFWIENRLFPKWQEADRTDIRLRRRLEEMRRREIVA